MPTERTTNIQRVETALPEVLHVDSTAHVTGAAATTAHPTRRRVRQQNVAECHGERGGRRGKRVKGGTAGTTG